MIFDTQTLSVLIERCFDLSMNGTLPPQTRAEYLAHGKKLREQLMQLLGARFAAGSAELQQATAALNETNQALTRAANDLNEVVQAVARVGELVGYLDKALGVAGRIIT